MKRAIIPVVGLGLLFLGARLALAQQLDDFEVPQDMLDSLKAPSCPQGEEPDGKGGCRKKKGKPKPSRAVPDRAPASGEKPSLQGSVAPAATAPSKRETPAGRTVPSSGTPAPRQASEPPMAGRPPLVPPGTNREETSTAAPEAQSGAAPEAAVPGHASGKETNGAEEGRATGPAGAGAKPAGASAEGEKAAGHDAGEKETGSGAGEKTVDRAEEKAGEKEPRREFIKGELGDFIGSNKLVTKNNRVGVRFGYRKLDLKHYATITPEADFRIWKFEIGLGVPLALEIFDGSWNDQKSEPVGFANAGSLRTEDWNEPGEYVRFLRYLRFGRKEDRVFLNLSQYQSMTLGHGALIRRYNPNIDPDSTRLAFELDMYNDYAGFELVANDITSWDVFGVLGFVKPLSFFMDGTVAKSLSLGFSYAADRHAPYRLATQSDPRNPYYVLGDDTPQVASSAFLHGFGVDMEVKVLKTDSVDLKPFVDYSWFMPSRPDGAASDPGGGGGFTVGLLGRFNFGSVPVHALRTIAEFRTFSGDYLPGYFDTFYEVQKYMLNTHYEQYAQQGKIPPTRFEDVFYNRAGEGRKYGFYLEFNYSLVGYFTFTFSLEGSNARAGNNLLAHIEVPALSWLQFFASYHHRAADGFGGLFGTGGDQVIFTAARLRLFPFLFVNFSYHYTFELRDDYADLTGDGLEEHYRLYDKMHGWLADVELGWEF